MQKPVHYGVVILGLAVLAVFGSLGLGRFGYTMVLPAMQDGLRLSNTQTGQLQSWNLLGYMLAVAVAGALAARFGPRGVITAALGLVGLSMAVTGLWPSFAAAAVARFLTGVGGAAGNVPAMGVVAAWFAARRRGLAAGTAVAGSSVGLMVTGPLTPVLLARFGADGWRVCWVVFGGMALVACVLCGLFLRNSPRECGLLPVGADPAVPPGPAPASTDRLPWRSVYTSPYLWHLAVVYFAFGFSYIVYSTFFVRHLVRGMGFSTADAGGVWFRIGILSTVSGLAWGMVSDRWGRRCALLLIFAVQGFSFVVLGLAAGSAGVYLSAVLFALTAWSIPAIVAALTGDVFGPRLAPAALGLVTLVFGLGQVLGPWIGGWLADRTQSFAAAFILAGVVALVLGGGATAILRRPPAAG